jgi:hypothetical protein
MKKSMMTSLAAAMTIAAVFHEGNARAQEKAPYLKQWMPAPSNAFELQLGTGYTQGFGNVFPSTSIHDVAGAGVGFTVGIGYRAIPAISVELEGQYQQYSPQSSSASFGFYTNLGATFHAAPHRRGDPWLRVGSGWRSVFQHNPTGPFGFATNNSTNAFHGWQVATVRFGYDIRSSDGASWAPFAGADVQAFVWENGNQLPTTQWGTFLYAGFQGRFDFGSKPSAIAAR